MRSHKLLLTFFLAAQLAGCCGAAVFTVNSAGDDSDTNLSDGAPDAGGVVTLRAAIEQANYNAVACTINFQLSGGTVYDIYPSTPLPAITFPAIIDGSSQPGYPGNYVRVRGSALTGTGCGLVISAGAEGSLVKGLEIGEFSEYGLKIEADGVTVKDCRLGFFELFDPNPKGNTLGGLYLNDANNCLIGGISPADSNTIIGNGGSGIHIVLGAGNVITGNYCGITSGNVVAGNLQNGIHIQGSLNTTIGGTSANLANVLSGNLDNGLLFTNASNAAVYGNLIGTNTSGVPGSVNGGSGIRVENSYSITIGSNASGARNVIVSNSEYGIDFDFTTDASTGCSVKGNRIGLSANDEPGSNGLGGIRINATGVSVGSGSLADANIIRFNNGPGVLIDGKSGNAIRGNTNYGNTGLPIDIIPLGFNPNDDLDIDTGPNNMQNSPILTSSWTTPTKTRISGTINTEPNKNVTLDFYRGMATGSPGYPAAGQAQVYIGPANVVTNSLGNATIDVQFASGIPAGSYICAAATINGSTSELSDAIMTPQYSDDPPAFPSMTVTPPLIVSGDRIKARVRVTSGEPGIAEVKADGNLMTLVEGTILDGYWEAVYVPIDSPAGRQPNILATNLLGIGAAAPGALNAKYKNVPVYITTIKSLVNYTGDIGNLFNIYAKVTSVSPSTLLINDGSPQPLTVTSLFGEDIGTGWLVNDFVLVRGHKQSAAGLGINSPSHITLIDRP